MDENFFLVNNTIIHMITDYSFHMPNSKIFFPIFFVALRIAKGKSQQKMDGNERKELFWDSSGLLPQSFDIFSARISIRRLTSNFWKAELSTTARKREKNFFF